MKSSTLLLPVAMLLLNACVADQSGGYATQRYPQRSSKPERDSGSAGIYSMGGTSTSNPPIKAGETSSAYNQRLERHQRESVPDAQVLYQSTSSDAFGRTTNTGIYQQSGGVSEEIHMGNQRVYPGRTIYNNGTVQPGYAPAGTTAVYDPVTGRVIPVRRR